MIDRKVELPQNPNERATYLRVAEELLDSHKSTRQNLEGHLRGDLQAFNRHCVGFYVFCTLFGKEYYNRGLVPEAMMDEGRSLHESWGSLQNKYLAELVRQDPRLHYPGEGNPVDYMWQLWRNSKDKEVSDAVDQTSTRANELALRDPQALPLLTAQLRYEEAALEALAPFWKETSESEYKDVFKYLEREPRDIQGAIEVIRSSHLGTEYTREYYETRGGSLVSGGYGGIYMLFGQDGYFASLFSPEQIMEGKHYIDAWRNYEGLTFRRVIEEYTDKVEATDPFKAIEDWPPIVQDRICQKAKRIMLYDPRSVEHFVKQGQYEVTLTAHLEGLKLGAVLPEPQTRDEVRKLLEACHRWTQINVETYEGHNWYGWRGGFRRFYDLLAKDGVVSQSLSTSLVDEGQAIYQDCNALKVNFLRGAIRKTWGIKIDTIDPEQFMQSLDDADVSMKPRDCFEIEKRALGDMLHDPNTLQHFRQQSGYEERALSYLLSN